MRKLATGTLLATLILVSVPGAPAAQAASDTGTFCLYEHDDFKGGKWCIAGAPHRGYKRDDNLGNNYWSGTQRKVNNGASSMKNTTRCSITLFDDYALGTGPTYYAQIRSQDADLTNNGMDNKASSLYMNCD
ncbi:peptidase inhibitor family I36 protein [Nonomuraea glycinis]|uniref:Peptidase inhibitor family I36 protein n=1 Tax=Nonomuraea glycinis TaxID=2047744 RepID=A0A918AAA6_9ACTN|nr:peptidase inhibitor family I36 protein [Nonomuraea glycinis]MCA2180056.1 peptidase inhibitor family I36 protein [Nonomuraea glycinis]GGP10786.1 hypothetical protein GCM10012278_51820 [Nonomuraea glycinis]